MTNILLIDDDEKLGDLLSTFFDRFDLRLDVAHDPETGLEKLAAGDPELVILDVLRRHSHNLGASSNCH